MAQVKSQGLREKAVLREPPVARYDAIDWSFNLTTSEFICDLKAANALFHSSVSIANIQELLLYMTPSKAAEMKRCFKYVIESGKSHALNCNLVILDQALTYVEIFIERTSLTQLQGTIRPLLKLESLQEVAKLFEGVFDNTHHGLILTDDQTRVLACNHYFEQHSGFKQNELLGLKANVFNAGKHSKEFFQSMWHDINTKDHWSGVILNRRASGLVAPQELTIQKIVLQDGRVFFVGMTLDLADNLHRVADTALGDIDLLTQLPTEQKFKALLETYCVEHPQGQTQIVLAFQPAFESGLHHTETLMLSSFLARSKEVKLVGYVGKDIYLVSLSCSECQKNTDFRLIQHAIRLFMKELKNESSSHTAIINGRIGVSVLGFDAKTPARMVTHAMQAMLEQHAGEARNISFYHSEIHQQVKRRKNLEDRVAKAIAQKDLEIHYQPIVDTKTWNIAKFEALCRFKPVPDLPFTTQEMINIAEELDLIAELDRCVSILSLQDLPKIKTLFGQGVGVTINRSFNTKMDATQILANTMEIIDRYTDTPQSVTIELTESAYFDSQSHQVDALNALRSRGVTVAIDDFGTGYSSFTYLSDCNFDYLKIDREFVTDIQVNSNKYSIVKMITELSHTLGVKVVAEGVETEHEVWVLKSLGIDYIQGYIFSKPLPLKELVRTKEYRNRFAYSGAKVEQERKPNCLLNLFKEGKPHLDPSEPISLAYQYIKATKVDVLPVVNQGECVGIVDVASLNLYLTPNMGTDLETTREAAVWRKPVNQIMKFHFTQLDAYTELNQVVNLIEKGHDFPWVLVDNTRYKGLLTQADVLRYLAESQ